MDVRIFIGAHAYACLTLDNGAKLDIRLDAGHAAEESLRTYASDKRREARDAIARADLADQAAQILIERKSQ